MTRDSYAQWSKNSAVNDTIVVAGGNQSVPVIAPDGSGGAIVVWQDERNGRPDIYANRIKASGRLAWMLDGVPIANLPESDQKSPAIVGNGQGAVFVAWQDDRNNSALSIFDIYAQKIDVLFGNSQWTPQGVLVQTGNNYVFPNIIRDSIFGAIVASYTFFNNNYFIFLQKLGDDTGDMQWDPQTVPSSQLESPQPLCPPAIISDDNRGAIIVWPDQRELPNGKLKVFAARLNEKGEAGWPQKEVPLSLPLRESTEPAIIPDGSGGVIVAWITPETDGSSNDQISVQRLSAQGISQWSRVVSTSPGSKGNVRIVRVNQDTSLVLWEDLGSGQDKDLRVQRINSSGEEIEAEFDIVSELGAQINPAVIANKRNGVIVAWEDNRSLQTDIYAQLIDANASLPWGPNGIAVSTAPDVQKHPVLVDDGLGGAIILWEDRRNGVDRDIYAQKVSVQGVLGEFRMIDVLAPNASGVNWEIGSSQEIRWNFQGEIDSVSIELSRDGGQTFPEVIFAATENVNSAIWQRVTGPASDQCKIRINAANANFILDESDTLFTISNAQGPTLKPDVVSHSSFGDSLFIRTSASDVSGINAIFLHVRKGGAVSFDSLAMAVVAADTYGVAVPREFVQERGFDFFISSTDKFNNYSSSDTQFVAVSFAAGAQTSRVSRGSEQTAYRMVSAPNLLDMVSVDSIFSNSGFGTQDTTSWRLFEYRSNGYVERNSLNAATFQFTPGQAYWLISSKDRTIDFGSGVSLRADTSFSVTLKPGWNQIALPFAFPVAWADILAASGSPTTVDGPHFYSGSYSIPDILLPYAGYFVNNLDSLKSVELTIPPLASESTSQNLTRSGAFDAGWAVQIIAKAQEAEDAFNYLGIQAEASDTWDPLDHSEPPPIGA
ncbi:MAG: hypothetical protein ACE5HO_04495, partial [bacterium]